MSTKFKEPISPFQNIDGWILPDYDGEEFYENPIEPLTRMEELAGK